MDGRDTLPAGKKLGTCAVCGLSLKAHKPGHILSSL